MVNIVDLPTELLLRVASYINNNADYSRLALTCSKLLLVTRECLYSSVVLNKFEAKGRDIPTLTLQFLRAVLQQPELTNLVKRLDITYAQRYINHESSDPKHLQCMCSHTVTRSMVRAFFANRSTANSTWILKANNAWEPALVGIILARLSELRALRLKRVTKEDFKGKDLPWFLRKHINLKSLSSDSTKLCYWELNQTLQSLEYLQFSNTASWDFTVLPSVKHLTLRLTFPHNYWDLVTRPSVPLQPHTATATSVSSLLLNCDLTILSTKSPKDDVMAAYLRDLLSLLPCLRRLVIRLEEPEVNHHDDDDEDVRDEGYCTFGPSN